MFRSLFRVVVVAVVVLSFTLSLAQAGQAKPQDLRRPAVEAAHGGWLGVALRWITGLVTASKPAPAGGHGWNRLLPSYGSCIDPWGGSGPCPS
jgi:hypothetical protein